MTALKYKTVYSVYIVGITRAIGLLQQFTVKKDEIASERRLLAMTLYEK